MITRIMQQESPYSQGKHQHLERPESDKTFCGHRYNDEWVYTNDFILGKDNLEDHISCGTCRNLAQLCLNRKKDEGRWDVRKRYIDSDFRKWGTALSGRATWSVNNILVWDLKVATHESVKDLTEGEVKTLINNAINSKLLSEDLTKVKNIGKTSAKEIMVWLGRKYLTPKSKRETRLENALKKCIQVMMEKGVPSIAFDEGLKEWKSKQ